MSAINSLTHHINNKLLFIVGAIFFAAVIQAKPLRLFIDKLPFPASNGSILKGSTTNHKGRLWMASYTGYFYRNNGKHKSSEFTANTDNMRFDAWGRIWSKRLDINGNSTGFIDTKNGNKHHISFVDILGKSLTNNNDYNITSDFNHLYLFTYEGNLYQAKLSSDIDNTLKFKHLSHLPFDFNHSNNTDDVALTIDSLGQLWLASNTILIRYHPISRVWTNFSDSLNPLKKIHWDVQVAITNQQTTWVVPLTAGQLLRIDKSNQTQLFDVPYRIQNIQEDHQNNIIWLATNNGIYFIEGEDEHLQHYVPEPWQEADLSTSTFFANLGYLISLLVIFWISLNWFRARKRLGYAKLIISLFENTSEGLCILSHDFNVLQINSAMQSMVGWTQGLDITQLLNHIQIDKEHSALVNILSKLKQNHQWQGEAELLNTSNNKFTAEFRVNKLKDKDSINFILVIEDISERKEHESQLIHITQHDYITQLPNRLYFDNYLNDLLLNLKPSDRYALMLLDIDDFKTINDSMGHKAGDEILKCVAINLQTHLESAQIPNTSFLARLSGDEFIIIVEAPNDTELFFELWANDCLIQVKQTANELTPDFAVTASMGITFFPDDSIDSNVLLQQADLAMYQAKKEGKGKFNYFSISLETDLKHRIELESAILHNVGHFGLEVYFQPKIDLENDLIIGVEALSRWRLASGELLSPYQFLPYIRSGEMERKFDLAVVKLACQALIKFQKVQSDFKMSINISPRDLEDNIFVNQLRKIVDIFKLKHSTIIIEILEDAGISMPKVLENIKKLHYYQFLISIDDFGTGYSSLSHLNQLSANELKIDKSFLQGIPGNCNAEKLFYNIVELGRRFDMSVTSEGVETKEQLNFVKSSGCSCYQGYYYSPPISYQEMHNLLKTTHNKLKISA